MLYVCSTGIQNCLQISSCGTRNTISQDISRLKPPLGPLSQRHFLASTKWRNGETMTSWGASDLFCVTRVIFYLACHFVCSLCCWPNARSVLRTQDPTVVRQVFLSDLMAISTNSRIHCPSTTKGWPGCMSNKKIKKITHTLYCLRSAPCSFKLRSVKNVNIVLFVCADVQRCRAHEQNQYSTRDAGFQHCHNKKVPKQVLENPRATVALCKSWPPVYIEELCLYLRYILLVFVACMVSLISWKTIIGNI